MMFVNVDHHIPEIAFQTDVSQFAISMNNLWTFNVYVAQAAAMVTIEDAILLAKIHKSGKLELAVSAETKIKLK